MTPPGGSIPWIWKGAETIVPTVCRGFSEEKGSWKIICILRRSGTISLRERWVMSSPSNSIVPSVGSSSRIIVRPAVDLPHPLSPTRPRVSPG